MRFEVFTKSASRTAFDIKANLAGKKGIIYFGLCFDPQGSHIDFWNGTQFMNQVLLFSPGDDLPPSSDLFATARGDIKFSPTP